MEKEKIRKVRRFGTKEEQNKMVNRILVLAMVLFYLLILLNVWASYSGGFRSIGYAVMVTVMIAVLGLLNAFFYFRNKKSDKVRITVSIGFSIVNLFVLLAFTNEYLRYLTLLPLVICILYYDKKLIRNLCIFTWIIQALSYWQLLFVQKRIPEDRHLDFSLTLFTVFFLLLVIYFVVHIGHAFNHDTLYNLYDEKAMQQEMIENILQIAGQVQTGVGQAMELVDELDESSEVVRGAVSEISEGTQSTAENIQNQSAMTQDIQKTISQIVERSSHMVEVASVSKASVEENLTAMQQLNQQSEAITQANSKMAEMMDMLKDRTEQVKNIAGLIFSISSQTNLLALNASIESARAGEAGRGFAVVAEQIRKLAEETRKETENIAQILEELNENTKNAKQAVDQSVLAAKEQGGLIQNVSEGFEAINRNVDELTGDIEGAEDMLTKLSEANQGLVENITYLSAATEEVMASSQQAKEISEGNKENADSAKKMLEQVIESSYGLEKYIPK